MEESEEEEEEEGGENDIILNEIIGSDMEDESGVVYVPPLKTVTKRGKTSGRWQKNFPLNESDSDELDDTDIDDDHEKLEPVKSFHTTRSGRRAGYIKSKYL